MNIEETINALAADAMHRQNEAVEEACERMLVSSVPCGVLVETYADGAWTVSLTTEPQYEPMTISYQQRDGKMPVRAEV